MQLLRRGAFSRWQTPLLLREISIFLRPFHAFGLILTYINKKINTFLTKTVEMDASFDFPSLTYRHTSVAGEIKTCIPFERFTTVESDDLSAFPSLTYRHTSVAGEIKICIPFERFTTVESDDLSVLNGLRKCNIEIILNI
jgi:hypothetical protein